MTTLAKVGQHSVSSDICSECRQVLNIGALLPPASPRLHATLEGLRLCALNCGLCKAAWEALRTGFLNQRKRGAGRPWLNASEGAKQFYARAKLTKWFGYDSVTILAERFIPEAADHPGASPLPYWEALWLAVRTLEGDPAEKAGVAWVRWLEDGTGSPASLALAARLSAR